MNVTSGMLTLEQEADQDTEWSTVIVTCLSMETVDVDKV